jgi:hypothetical protein
MTTPEETCRAVGDLIVAGNRVGWLRCGEPAGHEQPQHYYAPGEGVTQPVEYEPGTPHRAVLEWSDDAVELDAWPEAYDPDETFDVDVELVEQPVERPDEVAKREARTTRPGTRCPERLPDGARCIAAAGHDFGHLSASGDRWGFDEPLTGPTGGMRNVTYEPTDLYGPGR